jgi:hypothetical protein
MIHPLHTYKRSHKPWCTQSPVVMTHSTPISPPTETPISPISRSTTFPHKTSPAVATQTPLIDTSVPAINAHPVELDGVPTSPQEQDLKRRETGGSRVLSPADGEIDAEFLSEDGKGAGQLGREVGLCLLRTCDWGARLIRAEARCDVGEQEQGRGGYCGCAR